MHDPAAWRPAAAAVALLAALQEVFGIEALWQAPGARPEFFDKLIGTNSVRERLLAGVSPDTIVNSWQTAERRRFDRERLKALLYPRACRKKSGTRRRTAVIITTKHGK